MRIDSGAYRTVLVETDTIEEPDKSDPDRELPDGPYA